MENIKTDINVEFALSIGFKFNDNEKSEPNFFNKEMVENACKTIIRRDSSIGHEH